MLFALKYDFICASVYGWELRLDYESTGLCGRVCDLLIEKGTFISLSFCFVKSLLNPL